MNLHERLLKLVRIERRITSKILSRLQPEEVQAPAKRYVNEHTIRITFNLKEESFQKLEQLKALKSHQVKDYIDHIHSVSQGSTNHPQNLQVLCQAHNQFKYIRFG